MEQHTAVKKMMLNIKLEGIIDPSIYYILRDYFRQMYAVGYDQGRADVAINFKKAIAQYNKEGHCINIFSGFREAVRRTGNSYSNLQDAVLKNRLCKGFHWRYVTPDEIKEIKEASRDRYMY